ncbi:MAG: UDP-N-acetylmuramate--L-alanine ligase [Chlorobi bacterium]|nr:UDP-N-acetylmuramate--L-alanine ligase [Chlorobiota bacterium]
MKIEDLRILYFLGIGGIGMSALARYCASLGIEIHGYDSTPSKLTSALIDEGMLIHFNEDVKAIPDNTDLVVYTPAIPKSNIEFRHIDGSPLPMVKRSQFLGLLSQEYFTIAVAGTHGKTSISSILAHILFKANKKVTALIGGVMNNYSNNTIISKDTDYLILEADEFDRSFLWLEPDISIISSVDDDHLDVYTNSDGIKAGFAAFAGRNDKDGLLILNDGVEKFEDISIESISYGLTKNADYRAEGIHILDGKFVFDFIFPTSRIERIKMRIPGRHYIENAMAAASAALQLGVKKEDIKIGLETFAGVERRFEYKVNNADMIFIDDYAHHPREIEKTLAAIKELYPDKKLTVVFQPHLYSRTRDFADGFAKSLEIADNIILLGIYPARELPIKGVTSAIILEKIDKKNKKILSKQELKEYVKENDIELLVSLGAGNIGVLAEELKDLLKNR